MDYLHGVGRCSTGRTEGPGTDPHVLWRDLEFPETGGQDCSEDGRRDRDGCDNGPPRLPASIRSSSQMGSTVPPMRFCREQMVAVHTPVSIDVPMTIMTGQTFPGHGQNRDGPETPAERGGTRWLGRQLGKS